MTRPCLCRAKSKDELGKAHDRIVLLEQQVAEKDRCIQELTDSLMLRVSG